MNWPPPWFPETQVHPAWMTELCALMGAVAVLLAAMAAIEWVDRSYSSRPRWLALSSGLAAVASLMLWLGPLNEYPSDNDQFRVSYWTQEVYEMEVMLLGIRHVIFFIGLGLSILIAMSAVEYFRYRERRYWTSHVSGLAVGLGLMILPVTVNI